MAADLLLFDADSESLERLELGEIHLTDSGNVLEGEPHRYGVKNVGTTSLRKIEIGVIGDDADCVQLAHDNEGAPGPFSTVGSSLLLSMSETLFRDEMFYFWMRPVYTPDDAEGKKDFKVVFSAESF